MAKTAPLAVCIWFNDQAEEAAKFYTSVFKDSKITRTMRYSDAGKETHGHDAGEVMTVEFILNGQRFTGLNGGPDFKPNEAVSIEIHCEDQKEVDYYWERLNEGGDPKAQQCGWLRDKYGVSWQVIPTAMNELMMDHESPKAQRAMKAMLGMKKLDLAALQRAYEGK